MQLNKLLTLWHLRGIVCFLRACGCSVRKCQMRMGNATHLVVPHVVCKELSQVLQLHKPCSSTDHSYLRPCVRYDNRQWRLAHAHNTMC